MLIFLLLIYCCFNFFCVQAFNPSIPLPNENRNEFLPLYMCYEYYVTEFIMHVLHRAIVHVFWMPFLRTFPSLPRFLPCSRETFLCVYFTRMRAILLCTVLSAERFARCFLLKTHVQCEIYERDLSLLQPGPSAAPPLLLPSAPIFETLSLRRSQD